jgi:peptidoglycan/xylan/chitin deacetylase (PgdA/CDA1 family)
MHGSVRSILIRWLLLPANVVLPLAVLATRFQNLGLIAATAVAHLFFFWAVMNSRCQWMGPVAGRFRTTERRVWLTIDDGPDGERTQSLATELQRRGVRATFFFIGRRVVAQPEVVRAVLACGHTVSNHSATHPRKFFWCLPRARIRAEVADGAAALAAQGVETRWFRPPVGHKPGPLHAVLEELDTRMIGWTVGGRDGWSADPSALVERMLARAHPGAILLLHEARAHSVATILAVVDALLAAGYSFTIPDDAALEC